MTEQQSDNGCHVILNSRITGQTCFRIFFNILAKLSWDAMPLNPSYVTPRSIRCGHRHEYSPFEGRRRLIVRPSQPGASALQAFSDVAVPRNKAGCVIGKGMWILVANLFELNERLFRLRHLTVFGVTQWVMGR